MGGSLSRPDVHQCRVIAVRFLLLRGPVRCWLVVRGHHRPQARAQTGEAATANTGPANRELTHIMSSSRDDVNNKRGKCKNLN